MDSVNPRAANPATDKLKTDTTRKILVLTTIVKIYDLFAMVQYGRPAYDLPIKIDRRLLLPIVRISYRGPS